MAAIRHPLTYRFPEAGLIRPGQRVLVPLAARRATGIVIRGVACAAPGFEIRDILRVLDPEPVLTPELLKLGLWIADYYHAPVGEVFRAMLPLRPETRRANVLQLTELGKQQLRGLGESLFEEVRESADAELLRYLAQHAGTSVENVRAKFPAALARALKERWVASEAVERTRGRRPVFAVRLAGPIPERSPGLSPVARRIIAALERQGPVEDHRDLLGTTRASLAALKKLGDAGFIEMREAARTQDMPLAEETTPPELTAEQTSVLGRLTQQLADAKFQATLLHGVTASGKTEIYLRLMATCLERARSALMLVPEIALTPAMQAQFFARFGKQVAVLHSGLTEAERHDAWWRARRGEARIVLGTRSAVFAPLANPGLVIVDEEHDASYKQEETPRYHGRDVAVVRAQFANALAVLGSATPSLESYWNAQQGKYQLAQLEERVGGRRLAAVEIVDMREEFRETHTKVPISRRLKEEIAAQLRAGAQTMILLNRRGYSWYLLCRSCGESLRCVNCSISLTYHRRQHRLICHYCGYSAPVPARCPACGSEYLHYVGEGTEKIEDKFAELFPGARVARLDRDVARRSGQFQHVLEEFRAGKIHILVGTQLIAKGHDFPGVTLVGVVSADIGLALPDFRSAERSFQLLTQAAGRAGRGESPGRVLVQTFYPDHYAIRLAAEQNYAGFFSKEIGFRRMMHYPPITALANVVAQDTKLERAAQVAKQIGDFFTAVEKRYTGLKILGPAPAPLARVEGRFRIQFLLKSGSRSRLHELLRQLVDYCEQQGILPRSVMIDMDPMSVM